MLGAGWGRLGVLEGEALPPGVLLVGEGGLKAGVLGAGWGGLGVLEGEAPPPGVLLVGEVPHDWLFPRCAAVVHHGGAGALSAHVATCHT